MFGEILIVLLLILLNSFFAMAEIAIVSARRSWLKQKADEGHHGARRALKLAEDPSSFLSTVQTGITLVGVLASVFSGATIAQKLGIWFDAQFPELAPNGEAYALALVVAVVAGLTLVVGELVPKRVAMARAEQIAVVVAWPLDMTRRCLRPLVWLLGAVSELCLRVLGIAHAAGPGVTEEEVKTMIAEGTEGGVFEAEEKKMLEGVMRLTDQTVRGIMTPRLDMAWIGIEDSEADIRSTIRTSGYSRLPVAHGDLEEVRGVLYAKDMLNAALDGQHLSVSKLMRPALAVPDTTTVLRLLEQFKASGQHMALVIDEYGTVEGLVTVADILMAIAGGFPGSEGGDPDKPVRRADGSWLIGGLTPVGEVEAVLNLKKMQEDGDYHTLAGFLLHQLGHIPATGERCSWQNVMFEVIDMDGRRIDKVLVTPLEPDDLPET